MLYPSLSDIWRSCAFEVQQFGSIPELLQLAASVDLLKISEGMKEYSAELRRDAASFWSSVLHRVDAQLSGTSNVQHSETPGRELVKSRYLDSRSWDVSCIPNS